MGESERERLNWEVSQLRTELQSTRDMVPRSVVEEAHMKIDAVESEREKLTVEVSQLRAELQRSGEIHARDAADRIRHMEAERERLTVKVADLGNEVETLLRADAARLDEIQDLKFEKDRLNDEVVDLTQANAQSLAAVEEARITIHELEREREQRQAEVIDLRNDLVQIRNSDDVRGHIENLEYENDRLAVEVAGLRDTLKEMQGRIDARRRATVEVTQMLAPAQQMFLDNYFQCAGQFGYKDYMPQIKPIFANLESQTCAEGTVIMRQGDPSENAIIISEGSLRVFVNGHHVRTLGLGVCIGERGLMDGEVRSATVEVASDKASFWIIEKEALLELEEMRLRATIRALRDLGLPILQDVSEADIIGIVRKAKMRSHWQGATVARQGEPASNLYVVIVGTLRMEIDGAWVQNLDGGNYFGDREMIYGEDHLATVVVESETALLCEISKQMFLDLTHGPLRNTLAGMRERRVPGFQNLSDEVISSFIEASELKSYVRGELIFQEGARGDEFFIIDNGTLMMSSRGQANRMMEAGDFFGENCAVFDEATRESTVEVLSDKADIWAIDKRHLQEVLRPDNALKSEFKNWHARQSRIEQKRSVFQVPENLDRSVEQGPQHRPSTQFPPQKELVPHDLSKLALPAERGAHRSSQQFPQPQISAYRPSQLISQPESFPHRPSQQPPLQESFPHRPSQQISPADDFRHRPTHQTHQYEGYPHHSTQQQMTPSESLHRPSQQPRLQESYPHYPTQQLTPSESLRRPSQQPPLQESVPHRPSRQMAPSEESFPHRLSPQVASLDNFPHRPSQQMDQSEGYPHLATQQMTPPEHFSHRPSPQSDGFRSRPSKQFSQNEPDSQHRPSQFQVSFEHEQAPQSPGFHPQTPSGQIRASQTSIDLGEWADGIKTTEDLSSVYEFSDFGGSATRKSLDDSDGMPSGQLHRRSSALPPLGSLSSHRSSRRSTVRLSLE